MKESICYKKCLVPGIREELVETDQSVGCHWDITMNPEMVEKET